MDYLANYDKLPTEVQKILNTFNYDKDQCKECQRMYDELQVIGWVCGWGTDGILYDLKPKQNNSWSLKL